MESNPILKYLNDLSEITKKATNGALYQQMNKDAKPVKISLLKDVFTPQTIDTIKRQIQPKIKECYKNATLLAYLFPEAVQYVEGYMTIDKKLPVEHAFNLVNGKYYVDVTKELALGESPCEELYVALGEWNFNEVEDVLFKTQVYGGIYQNKVIQTINNKK